MQVDLITKEDLIQFKAELLVEIKQLLGSTEVDKKQWLKSAEVMKMLKISSGTLQNLRINGTLPYQKIGGTLYYAYADIDNLLKRDSVW